MALSHCSQPDNTSTREKAPTWRARCAASIALAFAMRSCRAASARSCSMACCRADCAADAAFAAARSALHDATAILPASLQQRCGGIWVDTSMDVSYASTEDTPAILVVARGLVPSSRKSLHESAHTYRRSQSRARAAARSAAARSSGGRARSAAVAAAASRRRRQSLPLRLQRRETASV